jgi:HSP20 family protein
MMTTHFLVPRRSASPVAALGWNDFDRVFDQLWGGFGDPTRVGAGAASYAPRIDFTETDTEMRVAAELPGLEEKDIEVSLEEGVLTIRGERAVEEPSADAKGVPHVETFRGKFQRSLRLPSEVDADAVKAEYRNGILTVTLPKPPEAQPQVRSIPVTNGS